MKCGMCGDTGLQNEITCPQPECEAGAIARWCLEFSNDLMPLLQRGQIPSHEHWNENNCNNLRNLIAAIARKHFYFNKTARAIATEITKP